MLGKLASWIRESFAKWLGNSERYQADFAAAERAWQSHNQTQESGWRAQVDAQREQIRMATDSLREAGEQMDKQQERHSREMDRLTRASDAAHSRCDAMEAELSESRILAAAALKKVEACEEGHRRLEAVEQECQRDRQRLGGRVSELETWRQTCVCKPKGTA